MNCADLIKISDHLKLGSELTNKGGRVFISKLQRKRTFIIFYFSNENWNEDFFLSPFGFLDSFYQNIAVYKRIIIAAIIKIEKRGCKVWWL